LPKNPKNRADAKAAIAVNACVLRSQASVGIDPIRVIPSAIALIPESGIRCIDLHCARWFGVASDEMSDEGRKRNPRGDLAHASSTSVFDSCGHLDPTLPERSILACGGILSRKRIGCRLFWDLEGAANPDDPSFRARTEI
jgi:hypothetical protein